ncbi:MAG: LPS export ABC transporter periplasmic protein LptC [Spirochaetaceae bacterium]|nr:LPS export ABC transporter periplasmic protein LptC [Spirochaetaceae bacterium]
MITSCSLVYKEDVPVAKNTPELMFKEAKYLQYQDGNISAELTADELEQYKDDEAMYGKNINFATFNKEGEITAEGSCQMICANITSNFYTLIGNVDIFAHEQNTSLKTENLRWNGKTEQLVCGKEDVVYISKGNTKSDSQTLSKDENSIELAGKGFSASAISRSYVFTEPVSGVIYVKNQDSKETK